MEESPIVAPQSIDASTIKRLWRVFGAVLAATVFAEIWVPSDPHFEIEGLFAFSALFGFIACAAMILAARGLALWLKRPEDYYREHGDE